MKIIVLGASGQLGSVISNGLKATHEVEGTSRKVSDRYIQFDPFSDGWSSLGKPDVLINCVGQIQSTTRNSFYHIHVELTKQILAHRRQIGNPRIIQVSALGASSEHPVEFLKTKGIADDLLLQHPNTAVIRPSIVCTPRTLIVRKMIMLSKLGRLLFGAIPVPKGFLQTRIQPIMPEDLVELVEKTCHDHDVKVLDAVGPEAITFLDMIKVMLKCRGQKLRLIEISKKTTDLILKKLLSVVLPKVINAQQYQLLFLDNIGSVARGKQMLGRSPASTREFFQHEFALKCKPLFAKRERKFDY